MCHEQSLLRQLQGVPPRVLTFCVLSGRSQVFQQAPDTVVYDYPRYTWKSLALHSAILLNQTESECPAVSSGMGGAGCVHVSSSN